MTEISESFVDYVEDTASVISGFAPQGVTGQLAGSFKGEFIEKTDDEIVAGVFSNSEYWRYVNFGTLPFNMKLIPVDLNPETVQKLGKKLYRDKVTGQPLVPIVWDWARLKVGITDEVERYNFCWSVFRKISREGITAQHFTEKGKEEMQKSIHFKVFERPGVEVKLR